MNFVALYRGESLRTARLVAVSDEPELIEELIDRLLEYGSDDGGDTALVQLEEGRRAALKLIRNEREVRRCGF